MRAAVTGAHNRVFPRARVGSRVINRGKSPEFLLQRAETYVFHIRSAFNSGCSQQLHIATHNYNNRKFVRTSIATYVRAKQFVDSYLWL